MGKHVIFIVVLVLLTTFSLEARSHYSEKDISELIDQGVDVNTVDDEGHSPLYYAITYENCDLVEQLIQQGADVNQDYLVYHAASRDLKLVQILVENGASLRSFPYSPLQEAIVSGKEEIALYLIDQGVDVDIYLDDGDSFLNFAVECDLEKVARKLVDLGLDVNDQNEYERTPLMNALLRGHESLAFFLFNHGASIDKNIGVEALVMACESDCCDFANLLIANGVEMNALNQNKQTPLIAAINYGNQQLVDLLISKGADITFGCPDYYGDTITPLVAALESQNEVLASLLIDLGADVLKSTYSVPPLHLACQNGMEAVVEKLLELGADLNVHCSVREWSPLAYAATSGYLSICETLIQHGSACALEELLIAIDYGNDACALYLIDQFGVENAAVEEKRELTKFKLESRLRTAEGETDVIRSLLEKSDLLDQVSDSLKFCLQYAIACNHTDLALYLIEMGLESDYKGDYRRYPPLLMAIEDRNQEIIYALIDAGIDVSETNSEGYNALHRACLIEDIELVTFLLQEKKMDPNAASDLGKTPLHECMYNSCNNIDLVQTLLDHGADLNARDKQGFTPLHRAVGYGLSSEMVAFLISKGAQVDTQDLNGNTPLHHVCSLEVASLLIEHNLSLNAMNRHGRTPLHSIICHVYEPKEIVALFLRHHADVNAKTEGGKTPLHLAIGECYYDTAELLLEQGACSELTELEGYPPLLLCMAHDPSFCRLLIRYGAAFKPQDFYALDYWTIISNPFLLKLHIEQGMMNRRDDRGRTLLMSACSYGCPESVEELVNAGADLNAKDWEGNTALTLTSSIQVADFLIAHGADVNTRDRSGSTPLLTTYSVQMQNMLLKAGANLQVSDRDGKTPLHRAALIGNTKLVVHLLNQDTYLNPIDDIGETPLHYLAEGVDSTYNKVAIAHLLLKKGADLQASNQYGNTPLHEAVTLDDPSLAIVFIDYGADVNALNEDLESPLHQCRNATVMDLLLSHGANPNAVNRRGLTPLHTLCDSYYNISYNSVLSLLEKGANVNYLDAYGKRAIEKVENSQIIRLLVDYGATEK